MTTSAAMSEADVSTNFPEIAGAQKNIDTLLESIGRKIEKASKILRQYFFRILLLFKI